MRKVGAVSVAVRRQSRGCDGSVRRWPGPDQSAAGWGVVGVVAVRTKPCCWRISAASGVVGPALYVRGTNLGSCASRHVLSGWVALREPSAFQLGSGPHRACVGDCSARKRRSASCFRLELAVRISRRIGARRRISRWSGRRPDTTGSRLRMTSQP